VAVLRSFTVEPAVPIFRAHAFASGFSLQCEVGGFNAWAQELLDPTSPVYGEPPDACFLIVRTADLSPGLWESFADLADDEVQAETERVTGLFAAVVRRFRESCDVPLVVHTLELPSAPAHGALDDQLAHGQQEALAAVNDAIRSVVREQRGVYVLEIDRLVRAVGQATWDDPRRAASAGMAVSLEGLTHLTAEWTRMLHPMLGKTCKVLAVDLDDTLWGGIVGEDGVDGIRIGSDSTGAPYLALQRAIRDLTRRGILVAACSKNNLDDARAAFESHAGMLLGFDDFAAVRINWQDKATNLTEIARELKVGVDAIAFLDDNPVERALVRERLPEVTVLEPGDDPRTLAPTVREAGVFARLDLTDEDRARTRLYAEQRQRADLESVSTSLEDFLRSLEIEVEVGPVTQASIGRAAQLTQRTNQFNVTTRRYSEQELERLVEDPSWAAETIRVVDRFGDNGIVGVVIVHEPEGLLWEIDTLLLSCRVIGRGVETAMLSAVAERARTRGATALIGRFEPTAKNAPARDVFARHGFALEAEDEAGTTWRLDLQAQEIGWPAWVARAE
jgi:FkbH-like protein